MKKQSDSNEIADKIEESVIWNIRVTNFKDPILKLETFGKASDMLGLFHRNFEDDVFQVVCSEAEFDEMVRTSRVLYEAGKCLNEGSR